MYRARFTRTTHFRLRAQALRRYMNFRTKMRRVEGAAAHRSMHTRITSIPIAVLAISLMGISAACSQQEPALAGQRPDSDSVSGRDAVQTDSVAVGQSPAASPTDAQGATTRSASGEIGGSDISTFVPDDAVVLIERRGDLDSDGDIDVLLALENKSADESAPRSLVLLRRAGSGALEKAVDNPDAILCRSCGGTMGDPLADISVNAGEFSLRFEADRVNYGRGHGDLGCVLQPNPRKVVRDKSQQDNSRTRNRSGVGVPWHLYWAWDFKDETDIDPLPYLPCDVGISL